MISGWRIVKARYAAMAFSGDGARLAGGRWNSVGTPVVYTAQSASLATLEIVVNLGSALALQPYVLIPCDFEEARITRVDVAALPANWRVFPAPPALASIGDSWATRKQSAVLEVPSAVIPSEVNYLLNPQHLDFAHVRIGAATPFPFDPRLVKR
jgi:RES domain-containing protein